MNNSEAKNRKQREQYNKSQSVNTNEAGWRDMKYHLEREVQQVRNIDRQVTYSGNTY